MRRPSSSILRYEIVGFGAVLAVLWVDEILDLPHALFGSPPTPVNVAEAAVESLLVLIVGGIVVLLTKHLLSRLHHLEGLMHVCGFCGKVRDADAWVSMDEYLRRHSEAELRHTFCMDCLIQEAGYARHGLKP